MSADKGAYDDLPDGVVVVDAAGTVTQVNPAATRILATTADAVIGRSLPDVLPLVDAQSRDWWACSRPFDGLDTRTRQPEVSLQVSGGSRRPPASQWLSARTQGFLSS